MTVQQIVDKIKLLYPAAVNWSDAQIIDQLNIEQSNIMRDLLVEAAYDMVSMNGVRRYAMPANMQVDFIRHVLLESGTSVVEQGGTVSIAAGSKNVVGVGTAFDAALEDQRITIADEVFTVDTVTDGTHMTVTANAVTAATGAKWSLFVAPQEDVTFTEYPFVEYNDVLTRRVSHGWYRVDSETIGIYPTLTITGKAMRILHLPLPTALSSTAMTASPDLYYMWHMLLVYAVIREIAMSGSNPDTVVANNYAMMYNSELAKAKQDNVTRNGGKYSQTTDVMREWNGYRRRSSRRSRARRW